MDEYQYIFLCGSHYTENSTTDKRNVLRRFLENADSRYRPIILEDNFIFKRNSSRYLVYDDIHMKDLYQVEMLTNYLSDHNIIIHESISTGAEVGLFLSEPSSVKKTCILLPDPMAVEEDKMGQFMRLAFTKDPNDVKVIGFYPSVKRAMLSENVKYWRTYFYKNRIGKNLEREILRFMAQDPLPYQIKFVKTKQRIDEGCIHYEIKDRKLVINLLPRILLCCISIIFNITELEKKVFEANKKTLSEHIEDIKQCLKQVFINSIEEKTGADIETCSICPKMYVNRVYIGEIIGMSLYLFQAAGLIQIEKDKDYEENGKVKITRKIVKISDESKHFFYKKYASCLDCTTGTQIQGLKGM